MFRRRTEGISKRLDLLKEVDQSTPIGRPLVLIFGLTGAGKSSVINMLKGSPVGPAFDDANLCNLYHRILYRDGKTYTFWNTPDLDSNDAVRDLRVFVDEFTADLLVYCIEDALVDVTRFNYDLVWRDLCKGKVPILLVVTGLKGKPDGDVWWYENEEKIEEMKMSFDGHVCIPSWRNLDDKEYVESAEKLWSLVRAHFGPKHNVILFGEAGAGKSSVVNMIVGKAVAKVSSAPSGCTFQNDAYEAVIGDKRYVIYDTAGLNEGEHGRVPHWQAIRELYTLIRQLDGVSLLVYCMRGRVLGNARTNWNLFNKVICGGNVPAIAIVTGLESSRNTDSDKFRAVFKANGMEAMDVGCVVSIRGTKNEYADYYAESQVKVRALVTKHCLEKSWGEEKEKWFAAIYTEAYESGLCFTTKNRLDYSTQMKDSVDEFVRETEMKQNDTKKLRATLLKAEKKFRRRFWQITR